MKPVGENYESRSASMKTYTATVMISFAVDVEVEAENEDQARQLLDEKAWESYYKTSGESELYDFMEVTL
jgi:hypothetical protein